MCTLEDWGVERVQESALELEGLGSNLLSALYRLHDRGPDTSF